MGYTINDSDDRYNGWTNYETWRVNLEVFDGMDIREHFDFIGDGKLDHEGQEYVTAYDVAQWLEIYAHDFVTNSISDNSDGIVSGWIRAFLQEVNWGEIASHLIRNANDEQAAA